MNRSDIRKRLFARNLRVALSNGARKHGYYHYQHKLFCQQVAGLSESGWNYVRKLRSVGISHSRNNRDLKRVCKALGITVDSLWEGELPEWERESLGVAQEGVVTASEHRPTVEAVVGNAVIRGWAMYLCEHSYRSAKTQSEVALDKAIDDFLHKLKEKLTPLAHWYQDNWWYWADRQK